MTNKTEKYFKIMFGEPATGIYFEEPFLIPSSFFEVLKQKPKRHNSKTGNAYIFGKLFPLNEYKHIGFHDNDVAQTGLIDVTSISPKELDKLKEISEYDVYAEYNYDYDNREALEKLRNLISFRILFIGETQGGDVGADIYLHKDINGDVNGLIIENNCLFRNHEDGVRLEKQISLTWDNINKISGGAPPTPRTQPTQYKYLKYKHKYLMIKKN